MDVVALFFPFRRGFGCIAKPTAAHSPGCKTRVILASPDNCMQTPIFGHGSWFLPGPYWDNPAPTRPIPLMNPPMPGPYLGEWMAPPIANPFAENAAFADYESHKHGCKPKSAAKPKQKRFTEREIEQANRWHKTIDNFQRDLDTLPYPGQRDQEKTRRNRRPDEYSIDTVRTNRYTEVPSPREASPPQGGTRGRPETIESQNVGQRKRAKVTRESKGQRGKRKTMPSGDGASPTHERIQKKKKNITQPVDPSPSLESTERPQTEKKQRERSVHLSPPSLSPERPQTQNVVLSPEPLSPARTMSPVSPGSVPPRSEWDADPNRMWDDDGNRVYDGNRVWPDTPAAMVLPEISGLREAELSRMENVIAEAKSAVTRSIEECTRRQLELAGQLERTTARICER